MEESRTNEIRNLSTAVERLVGHWQSVRSPTYTLHFYYSPVVNGVGRIYAVQDFSVKLIFTLQGNYQIVAQDKESVTIKVTDDSDQAHESDRPEDLRQLLVPADGQSLRLQVFGGDVHEYVDGDYNPPPSNVPPPKEPLGPIDVPPFKLAIVEQSRMKHAGQSFDWYELDTAFVESGKLPDLRGAQLSSFVLARLRNLIPDIPAESYEENDGGGFVFDLGRGERWGSRSKHTTTGGFNFSHRARARAARCGGRLARSVCRQVTRSPGQAGRMLLQDSESRVGSEPRIVHSDTNTRFD